MKRNSKELCIIIKRTKMYVNQLVKEGDGDCECEPQSTKNVCNFLLKIIAHIILILIIFMMRGIFVALRFL